MGVHFDKALGTSACYWRLDRRDGVTLGFAGHDRDMVIAGQLYRAAPSLRPFAVELDDGLDPEPGELQGALSSAAIGESDLMAGRWDGAALEFGLFDWADPQTGLTPIWSGYFGTIEKGAHGFSVATRSVKSRLDVALAPATSPVCRAAFCGADCGLNAAAFTVERHVASTDDVSFAMAALPAPHADWNGGTLRWLDGPNTGLCASIAVDEAGMITPLSAFQAEVRPGDRAEILMGCDKSIATCADRFANARNFRGEPFLPGNDLLTRYAGG